MNTSKGKKIKTNCLSFIPLFSFISVVSCNSGTTSSVAPKGVEPSNTGLSTEYRSEVMPNNLPRNCVVDDPSSPTVETCFYDKAGSYRFNIPAGFSYVSVLGQGGGGGGGGTSASGDSMYNGGGTGRGGNGGDGVISSVINSNLEDRLLYVAVGGGGNGGGGGEGTNNYQLNTQYLPGNGAISNILNASNNHVAGNGGNVNLKGEGAGGGGGGETAVYSVLGSGSYAIPVQNLFSAPGGGGGGGGSSDSTFDGRNGGSGAGGYPTSIATTLGSFGAAGAAGSRDSCSSDGLDGLAYSGGGGGGGEHNRLNGLSCGGDVGVGGGGGGGGGGMGRGGGSGGNSYFYSGGSMPGISSNGKDGGNTAGGYSGGGSGGGAGEVTFFLKNLSNPIYSTYLLHNHGNAVVCDHEFHYCYSNSGGDGFAVVTLSKTQIVSSTNNVTLNFISPSQNNICMLIHDNTTAADVHKKTIEAACSNNGHPVYIKTMAFPGAILSATDDASILKVENSTRSLNFAAPVLKMSNASLLTNIKFTYEPQVLQEETFARGDKLYEATKLEVTVKDPLDPSKLLRSDVLSPLGGVCSVVNGNISCGDKDSIIDNNNLVHGLGFILPRGDWINQCIGSSYDGVTLKATCGGIRQSQYATPGDNSSCSVDRGSLSCTDSGFNYPSMPNTLYPYWYKWSFRRDHFGGDIFLSATSSISGETSTTIAPEGSGSRCIDVGANHLISCDPYPLPKGGWSSDPRVSEAKYDGHTLKLQFVGTSSSLGGKYDGDTLKSSNQSSITASPEASCEIDSSGKIACD